MKPQRLAWNGQAFSGFCSSLLGSKNRSVAWGASVTLSRRSLLQASSLVWGLLGGMLGEARPAQARLDTQVRDPQLLELLFWHRPDYAITSFD